ncbi:MAG: FAD:protein FMN transferase, partial [Frankiaceae bacterium]
MSAPAPATSPSPGVADFPALGTYVRLVTSEPSQLDEARDLLDSSLRALDQACSRFRPDSELMCVAAGRPVQVSPLLAEAVSVALRAAALTDGDVDPTLGDALAAVGYDRDFQAVAAVGPSVRIVTRPAPGWRRIRLDRLERAGALLTVPAGIGLDLGATAKAFAADRAAAEIAARLGCGVLVSLGGDVAVAGPPPPGGWVVRVQDRPGRPEDEVTGPTSTVAIAAGGLATSSTSARRWVRGDRVLHHVLNPRTGLPAASPWRTVSVTAATCVDANTASTASIVRGSAA